MNRRDFIKTALAAACPVVVEPVAMASSFASDHRSFLVAEMEKIYNELKADERRLSPRKIYCGIDFYASNPRAI